MPRHYKCTQTDNMHLCMYYGSSGSGCTIKYFFVTKCKEVKIRKRYPLHMLTNLSTTTLYTIHFELQLHTMLLLWSWCKCECHFVCRQAVNFFCWCFVCFSRLLTNDTAVRSMLKCVAVVSKKKGQSSYLLCDCVFLFYAYNQWWWCLTKTWAVVNTIPCFGSCFLRFPHHIVQDDDDGNGVVCCCYKTW